MEPSALPELIALQRELRPALERAVSGPGNNGGEAAGAVLEMVRLLAGPIGAGQ